MPFCTKCGTELQEEAKFCSGCGKPKSKESSSNKDDSWSIKTIASFVFVTVFAAATVTVFGILAIVYFFPPENNLSVPGDFSTIQNAINAAEVGDVIVVEPGTYYENIDFKGKDITLQSTDPHDSSVVESTIIHGENSGSVVIFRSGESKNAAIKGFTITGGSGTCNQYNLILREEPLENHFCLGGGILITGNSSPKLYNNIIKENKAHFGGGVIVFNNSSVHLIENTIVNNKAKKRIVNDSKEKGGGAGGGVVVIMDSEAYLSKNIINSNRTVYMGGGIFVAENSDADINNNTLKYNRTSTGTGGGISIVEHSKAEIKDNNVSENFSEGGFGGIGIIFGSSATIENNTVRNNMASDISGGIGIFINSSATVTHNIIKSNEGKNMGGLFVGTFSTANIINNEILNNYAKKGNGGGIHISLDSSADIKNNNITGNYSPKKGGAIFVSYSSSLNLDTPDSNSYLENIPDNIYYDESKKHSEEEIDISEKSNTDTIHTDEETKENNYYEDWPNKLSIGTAGGGGLYYMFGNEIGSIFYKHLNIAYSIEPTTGSVDNMILVHEGAVEMGMIEMGIGYKGWNALEDTLFENEKMKNVRAILPVFKSYSHWWAHAEDNITSLHDLEGKKVGVGPTGGIPGTYHPQILNALNIDATPIWIQEESYFDLEIDANSFASSIIPMRELITYKNTVGANNIVMLPIEGQDREQIIAKYPYWVPTKISADTYNFLDQDLETIAVFHWLVGHKDLPDTLVYQIVDVIMSNNDSLVLAHDAMKHTIPENVSTNNFLPLHPGAYNWFVDNGYEINPGTVPVN